MEIVGAGEVVEEEEEEEVHKISAVGAVLPLVAAEMIAEDGRASLDVERVHFCPSLHNKSDL